MRGTLSLQLCADRGVWRHGSMVDTPASSDQAARGGFRPDGLKLDLNKRLGWDQDQFAARAAELQFQLQCTAVQHLQGGPIKGVGPA